MTTEQAIKDLETSNSLYLNGVHHRLEMAIELLEELIKLLAKVHGNDTK